MHEMKRRHSRRPDRSSSNKMLCLHQLSQHTQNVPMYKMPLSMDHTTEAPSLVQVSTIKTFLQSCLKLLNDPSSVKVLQNMLEICNIEEEGKLE
jgi:hypothetical protein